MRLGSVVLSLAVSVRISVARELGYFDDISTCADPDGLATCFDRAETRHGTCIDEKCPENKEKSRECAEACGGKEICAINCPGSCVSPCGAERAGSQIDCIASSCWNQVYSCEYQLTVEDFISLYQKEYLDDIPFWPPPDKAPGGCSCNTGKVRKKELQIENHLTACLDNTTNLDSMEDDLDDHDKYVMACQCCAESAVRSTIYDTCPNTRPSIIDADYWFGRLLDEEDWSSCRSAFDDYNCAGDLGFGAEDAGGVQKYYKPGEFPKNGTETLYNTNGVISTPISGASFTWDYSTDVHTVTVRSTDYVQVGIATTTETQTSTTDSKSNAAQRNASQTDTGVGSTAMGKGPASGAPLWRTIGLAVILTLLLT
ncbi:unnamed protein product [Penicillium pancosmium]